MRCLIPFVPNRIKVYHAGSEGSEHGSLVVRTHMVWSLLCPWSPEEKMRYWGVCTSQENWELCKRTLLWGMDWRYFVTLERFLKPGDKAVVYMHGGRFPAVIEF